MSTIAWERNCEEFYMPKSYIIDKLSHILVYILLL